MYNYFCFKWSRLCDCQLARHQEHLGTSMAHHGMASCDSSLISNSVRRHHLLSNVEAWQPLEHELTRNAKVYQFSPDAGHQLWGSSPAQHLHTFLFLLNLGLVVLCAKESIVKPSALFKYYINE